MSAALTCEDVTDRDLLEGYLAGTLADDEAQAFEGHLVRCERCQAELRLAVTVAHVAREVPIAHPARKWAIPAGAGALAAAALIAGLLLLRPSGPDETVPAHREPSTPVVTAPVPQTPVGTVTSAPEFRWSPVPSADRYRVTVFDRQGAAIWETETTETRASPPAHVGFERGGVYLWKVAARVGWDRWVSSELVEFSIPEP